MTLTETYTCVGRDPETSCVMTNQRLARDCSMTASVCTGKVIWVKACRTE